MVFGNVTYFMISRVHLGFAALYLELNNINYITWNFEKDINEQQSQPVTNIYLIFFLFKKKKKK